MNDKVPHDVAVLVVAGRDAWEYMQDHCPNDNVTVALEKALEEFASRVCWDDEGGSIPEAHAHPCTCAMSEIQCLGQEFDAGEAFLVDGDAAKHMRALGHIKDTIPSYMGDAPKAQHYQVLHAALDAGMDAIQNVARHAHKPVAYYYSDGQQEWLSMRDDDGAKADCDFKVIPLYAHPPQSREPSLTIADAGGVTDADREAAAKCVEHGLSRPNPLNVRQGVVDSWHLVQAFAAHRLQSVAAATAAKDAEIENIRVTLLDPVAVHMNMLRGSIAQPSARSIIHVYGEDAIRAALLKGRTE